MSGAGLAPESAESAPVLVCGYDPYTLRLNGEYGRPKWDPPHWLQAREKALNLDSSVESKPWARTQERRNGRRAVALPAALVIGSWRLLEIFRAFCMGHRSGLIAPVLQNCCLAFCGWVSGWVSSG